ncbi:MAG: hypothetical protein RL660_249 [Bacteroidota bacterium]|jgi:hypothetical protein
MDIKQRIQRYFGRMPLALKLLTAYFTLLCLVAIWTGTKSAVLFRGASQSWEKQGSHK